MYLISEFSKYDQKKSEADKRFSIDFQGKKIHPCKFMIYWYIWGEYTFDVREVRKAFGVKECKAIDMDFKINPCIRFQKIINEITNLIGETPFIEVFKTQGTACT